MVRDCTIIIGHRSHLNYQSILCGDAIGLTLWQVARAVTASLTREDMSLRPLFRPEIAIDPFRLEPDGAEDYQQLSIHINSDHILLGLASPKVCTSRWFTSSIESQPKTIVPICNFFNSISDQESEDIHCVKFNYTCHSVSRSQSYRSKDTQPVLAPRAMCWSLQSFRVSLYLIVSDVHIPSCPYPN